MAEREPWASMGKGEVQLLREERDRLREALEGLKEAVVTWHGVSFNLRGASEHSRVCAVCQAVFAADDALRPKESEGKA